MEAVAKPSARVFVHPRCLTEVGLGVFEAMLSERGYDIDKLCVKKDRVRTGVVELVRRMGFDAPTGVSTFARMDGTVFTEADVAPEAPRVA